MGVNGGALVARFDKPTRADWAAWERDLEVRLASRSVAWPLIITATTVAAHADDGRQREKRSHCQTQSEPLHFPH
jgi:hypothetical protein